MVLKKIVVGRDIEDMEKYGDYGTIFLGRHIVGTGEQAHLTNPIMLDVARPHIILIVGKRGQGKSYSGAVIAEEISKLPEEIKKNLCVLMIDTMGIFWTMKSPNERQLELLDEWGLKPGTFDVHVYVPIGWRERFERAEIPFDSVISIRPADLTAEDWALAFNISMIDEEGILLSRVLKKLRGTDYGIDEIIEATRRDERAEKKTKDILENRFVSAKEWGIFSATGTKMEELMQPGKISIIDVSYLAQLARGWSVRSLLVGLLARRLYEIRIEARRKEEIGTIAGTPVLEVPLTWLIIDEAHNFLPAEGKTAASDPLTVLVRQGRQPGISCTFLTQRPGKLHETAIAQADLIISHRLTAKPDLEALRNIMQTYLMHDIQKYINELPREKGAAIILDDNSERIYRIKVRPRQSWHGGRTPSAIKGEF